MDYETYTVLPVLLVKGNAICLSILDGMFSIAMSQISYFLTRLSSTITSIAPEAGAGLVLSSDTHNQITA
jgi:hypothetical protein